MKSTREEKTAFATVLLKTLQFYDKALDAEQCADWYELLKGFELTDIATAFNRHLTDPKHGSYLPKPADIFRQLNQANADDGRPGADEAWGMLLRVIGDERETAVLTDEMRIGWTACQPILDRGDEVGARLAFRESYAREVEKARKMAVAPRWTPTLGLTLLCGERGSERPQKPGESGWMRYAPCSPARPRIRSPRSPGC